MADGSKIEWTDATWNPITGCSVLTPGCINCYAMKLAGTRLAHHPSRAGLTTMTKAGPVWNGEVRFNPDWLDMPLRWSRPRMVFVCAHGDLFHESVPVEWIDKVFAVMALCPQHTFQVLTKRAERMLAYMLMKKPMCWISPALEILKAWPNREAEIEDGPALSNVWLGVSAERQKEADERIPFLLEAPAAVRFVSLEPLIGPITLWDNSEGVLRGCGVIRDGGMTASTPHDPPEGVDTSYPGLDWVIVGGESGKDARLMREQWVRDLRNQCTTAHVPFFFKQWGEFDCMGTRVGKKAAGRYLDNRHWDEMPETTGRML